MQELWRQLKVGDKVRVMFFPPTWREDELHQSTLSFYKEIIKNGTVLEVYMIDEIGLPWGGLSRVVNGREEFEGIALNHDGVEIVA